jgi:hypothetical protein
MLSLVFQEWNISTSFSSAPKSTANAPGSILSISANISSGVSCQTEIRLSLAVIRRRRDESSGFEVPGTICGREYLKNLSVFSLIFAIWTSLCSDAAFEWTTRPLPLTWAAYSPSSDTWRLRGPKGLLGLTRMTIARNYLPLLLTRPLLTVDNKNTLPVFRTEQKVLIRDGIFLLDHNSSHIISSWGRDISNVSKVLCLNGSDSRRPHIRLHNITAKPSRSALQKVNNLVSLWIQQGMYFEYHHDSINVPYYCYKRKSRNDTFESTNGQADNVALYTHSWPLLLLASVNLASWL